MMKSLSRSSLAIVVVLGASACVSETNAPTLAEPTLSKTSSRQAADEVGCGVVSAEQGRATLRSIRRADLPTSIYSGEHSKTESGKSLFRYVRLSLDDGRHASCIVPLDAPKNVDTHLTAALKNTIRVTVSRSVERSSNQSLSALADSALFLPFSSRGIELKTQPSPKPAASRSARLSTYADPQPMPPWVITGTTMGGGGLIFDTYQFDAMLRTLFRRQPTLMIAWSGSEPPDCQDESAMEIELLAWKSWVDNVISGWGGTDPAHAIAKANMCPDSLMSVDEYCLDVYIAANTLLGIPGSGNGRGSDPYARFEQSKFQFIAHFNEEPARFDLLIGGSVIAGNVGLPTGHNWVFDFTAPYVPQWNIEKMSVTSINDTTKRVDLKVVNGQCAVAQNMALSSGIANLTLPGVFVDVLCPAIDAELTYKKSSGSNVWFPTAIVRDKYPTYDVWKKSSSGMERLYHGEEGLPSGLLGLFRVRAEIDRLLQDLNDDHMCELQ
ncbi:MAG: hypothetical protein ACO1Q7_17590 [Gemmatimonas sp.]